MNKSDFFFCYNKRLADYLRYDSKIDFITIAMNPTTKKIFTLFYKTDELQIALDKYKSLQKS